MSNFDNIKINDALNFLVSNMSTENPLDYFDKIYSSINPIMMMNAVEAAKELVKNENDVSKGKLKGKNKEEANVFITLGGESLTQNLYTGVIGTLLWLPQYITEVAKKNGVDDHSLEICLNVLNKCSLPKVHDVKESVIDNQKVQIKPSSIKHYTAFLSSILSWLNNGVTDCTVSGVMKTNYELSKYLSSVAINSFPSVPFGVYYIGTCKTNDLTKLAEDLGKSFDWTKYMSNESYIINEPKFVVTTNNAPIVSVVGHPLTETFAVKTEDGESKWLGLFVETEEFAKLCAQSGITVNQLKKYIITTSEQEHLNNLEKHDPIAEFINKQKITNEIFKLRHKFSSVDLSSLSSKYDL